ncbi:MAG: CpsD/CapB family tyrosine-protein kinase [Gammaproteobacteria bacterium]|nr:CpsD/CapB family tyrosine-protein kinase [Gammaproteobacteria bacterium]
MSRIEEALRKAKESRSNQLISASSDGEVQTPTAVTGGAISVVKQSSSSSLIKLMKENVTIDDEKLLSQKIIRPGSEKSSVTDSFRYLRTQLLQKSKDENFIVLVTSCGDGVDSSFVSMNMGAAFSFDETKTSLVVDCDFQSDTLDTMLDLDYEYGLLDFLDGNAEVVDIIKDVGIKRLRVIPSGLNAGRSSESFTTLRMKMLLDGLVERYQDRYVVLNSPAVSESVDTSILIDLVDYVVVAVPYGKVKKKDLENTLKRIDKSKLIGVVMNDVPEWV